jgi:hypothetical protein
MPLLENGFERFPARLTAAECAELKALYEDDSRFRSTIDMQRFNFGKGQYRYFRYPLPPLVQKLRESLYEQLAPVANEWATRLKIELRYPSRLDAFLQMLRKQGQTKPTPLLLRYRAGDYNCLHQDLSGDLSFPYQVVFGLNDSYEGGQLVLTQQRPRMQTVPHVLTLRPGEAVAFTSNFHPELGKRGYFRTVFRHGVSRVERGDRYTLGIVFHDFK